MDDSNAPALPFGLVAAVLLTLAARGRLRHKDGLWHVNDDTPTGDLALDAALDAVAGEEQPRGTMHWLRHLTEAGEDDLRHRLLRHLTDTGVLEEEEHSILGLYTYRRYPTKDPDPEERLRQRVREVVLEDAEPDDLLHALIVLMDACNLTGEVFTAKEQDEHAGRLSTLAEHERMAHALSNLDPETAAAVLTATSAAATSATSTTF